MCYRDSSLHIDVVDDGTQTPADEGTGDGLVGIRVLIADDQALVRGGFGMILAAQPEALWITESTVKTQVTRIFGTFDVRDRAQAVVLAYESRLVKAGDSG